LRDDEILLDSKILTVADVVESMQSHRPYRPGPGIDAAVAEIMQHCGIWYDEAVCDACVGLLQERRHRFDPHRTRVGISCTEPATWP
jgi:HD-GYP domain-containing protein (c-di-GMP phosphodiesterase class II)